MEAPEAQKKSFFQLRELSHVHLTVSKLDRSVGWYTDNLGLESSFSDGKRLAILRLPDSEHGLTLIASKEKKIKADIRLTFKVSGGTVALEAWRLRLKKAGIPFSVRTHGERVRGLYLTDPDGYSIEIFCD